VRWLVIGIACFPVATVSTAGESIPEIPSNAQALGPAASATGAPSDALPALPLAPEAAPIEEAAADAERVRGMDLGALVSAHRLPMRAVGPEQLCLAKAVYHEAANQPLNGQLAVAQVILNRIKSGIFPKSVCAVVNQKSQFFRTASFAVPTDTQRWQTAVAVALVAQHRHMADVAPGALFFHASYVRPPWRGRHTRVAQIGDHIFYR
jgi:spore germination cell wall hydrolase CwlJ-like protein